MVLFYSLTLFISATLLFVVQPMVGKMVLPELGGTPSVWNTCMVFFQAVLLAGYLYAHGSMTWLGIRRQPIVHMILFAGGILLLPVAVAAQAEPPVKGSPALWLLGRLVITTGWPLFMVASTAPLLQKWFSHTRHPSARDPYFLYAASNAGSLIALLAYPFIIQRLFSLDTQSDLWALGYIGLLALGFGCALWLWRTGLFIPSEESAANDGTARSSGKKQQYAHAEPLSNARRAWWVLLAFVPSSLMLGVTVYITTNLAAVPLLWVMPLALYLLTFVLTFSQKQVLSLPLISKLLALLALLLGPLFFVNLPLLESRIMFAHLVLFFLAAMLCHGRLIQDRPHTQYLTEFYLWIAVGGVLGGVFNALIAPVVFRTVIEYPLIMCVACLLRPKPSQQVQNRRARLLDFIIPLTLAVVCFALVWGINTTAWRGTWLGLALLFSLVLLAGLLVLNRPVRFGLSYAVALFVFAMYARMSAGNLLHVERNFFGVKRVIQAEESTAHLMYHGTTVHGVQLRKEGYRLEPLAYYHRSGPVGDVFRTLGDQQQYARVGAVGLGTGAVAAYASEKDFYHFFEIDPAVVRIASDPDYFSYLYYCRGDYKITLGDGRLKLEQEPDNHYDLLFLDAYSSDAIPTHMLSREALALYVKKLKPDGLLAFHITNRFMDLKPVLARLALEAGLQCRARTETYNDLTELEQTAGSFPAEVVIMARKREDFGSLGDAPNWETLKGDPDYPLWTDQYTDLIRPLWHHAVQ